MVVDKWNYNIIHFNASQYIISLKFIHDTAINNKNIVLICIFHMLIKK